MYIPNHISYYDDSSWELTEITYTECECGLAYDYFKTESIYEEHNCNCDCCGYDDYEDRAFIGLKFTCHSCKKSYSEDEYENLNKILVPMNKYFLRHKFTEEELARRSLSNIIGSQLSASMEQYFLYGLPTNDNI